MLYKMLNELRFSSDFKEIDEVNELIEKIMDETNKLQEAIKHQETKLFLAKSALELLSETLASIGQDVTPIKKILRILEEESEV